VAHKWYYGRDGGVFGPYSGDELKGLALAGDIRRQDTVWQEGGAKRVAAARVKYLFDLPVAPATESEPPPALPQTGPTDFPDDAALLPLEESPAAAPTAPVPRKRHVHSIKGGTVVSQDGFTLRYRKKCTTCFYEDANIVSAAIRRGTTQVSYSCPRCKKNRPVEIQAVD
jgi:hypothetical protein